MFEVSRLLMEMKKMNGMKANERKKNSEPGLGWHGLSEGKGMG